MCLYKEMLLSLKVQSVKLRQMGEINSLNIGQKDFLGSTDCVLQHQPNSGHSAVDFIRKCDPSSNMWLSCFIESI